MMTNSFISAGKLAGVFLLGMAWIAVAPTARTQAQNACDGKAQALAANYANAQIISSSLNGSTCQIVIRVPGSAGKQDRILRKNVPAG